jgi:hypothetical protein
MLSLKNLLYQIFREFENLPRNIYLHFCGVYNRSYALLHAVGTSTTFPKNIYSYFFIVYCGRDTLLKFTINFWQVIVSFATYNVAYLFKILWRPNLSRYHERSCSTLLKLSRGYLHYVFGWVFWEIRNFKCLYPGSLTAEWSHLTISSFGNVFRDLIWIKIQKIGYMVFHW